MYYVLGIEPFNEAQVFGLHVSKKQATLQAAAMENKKSKLCCQRYEALTITETKKRKYNLSA